MFSAVRCSATSWTFESASTARANEAHLVARLAFDVEDFLAAVAHVDERLLRVVLLDLLARLQRNAEGERARARVVRRDRDAHRRDVAVGWQA